MKESLLLPLTPEFEDDPSREDFRISQPLEIRTLLGRMVEREEIVSLVMRDGTSSMSAILEVDRARRLLWLCGEPGDARLQRLVQAERVVAVGYLDHVKIQFDVHNLQWLPGPEGVRLACLLPLELYRFQRRLHFRVRPMQDPPPVVRLRLGQRARLHELTLIDVSMTGAGLLLPPGAPRVAVGAYIEHAEVVLSPDVQLIANLRVMHVTPLKPGGRGYHMGCTLNDLDADDLDALQRFIEHTQQLQRASREPD